MGKSGSLQLSLAKLCAMGIEIFSEKKHCGIKLNFQWMERHHAQRNLQLPLRQWGAGNVYLFVFSSWKVNIAKKPIAVMGL